jgi:regulator of RNase E activity RraA
MDYLIENKLKGLFCSLVSDVLDEMGYEKQAFPHFIRPLDENLCLIGRARTMLYTDIYERPKKDENQYELEIELVDSLQQGDVAVAACGCSSRIAPWGGLLSTTARVKKANGAIMDGFVRDVQQIKQMGFPVYAAGIAPLDSKGRGKVIEVDVPVECGGVRVCPGDIIFGDADGCVAIPQRIFSEVVSRGTKKLESEKETLKALESGKNLKDVFQEFGVL